MEEMSMEQIMQMGQQLFPEMSPEEMMDTFNKVREVAPPGFTDMQIAQLIMQSIKSRSEVQQHQAGAEQPARLDGLRTKFGL